MQNSCAENLQLKKQSSLSITMTSFDYSAPFFTTYWLQIILFGVCFLLGVAFKSKRPYHNRSEDRTGRKDSTVESYPTPGTSQHDDDAPHIPYSLKAYPGEEMVCRSGCFYGEMNKRRSVRDICNKQVPLEVIENCIRTAGQNFVSVFFLYVPTLILWNNILGNSY